MKTGFPIYSLGSQTPDDLQRMLSAADFEVSRDAGSLVVYKNKNKVVVAFEPEYPNVVVLMWNAWSRGCRAIAKEVISIINEMGGYRMESLD